MSTLKIKKLESGAFQHIDSVDGAFFLGRFNFKQEFNKAFLVEAYGAKRREYSIEEIEVFDYLGPAEPFTNWTDLENRLVELGYTGIETNGMLPTASSYISEDAGNSLVLGEDNKLFVPESSGGGGDIVLNFNTSVLSTVQSSERVASTSSPNVLNVTANVTKSSGLLTGPYEMLATKVLKTSTVKRLTYRCFVEGELSIILRVYAFKQNNNSTSIYDSRLLFEKTITSTANYYIQNKDYVTADFIDSNLIDGEFIVFTFQTGGGFSNSFVYTQNLTLTY